MNNKQIRVDPRFSDWLDDISVERIKKGLEREEIGQREITRMILNSESIKKLQEELITKRRKQNE